MKKRIAIQGIKGSYHHEAVEKYYGKDSYVLEECDSFKLLAQKVADGHSDGAVMAIENTIAGAILPNYSLLTRFGLHVVGEVYMPIHHHLLALPGTKLSDITEVRSHYMALLQCESFFEEKKIQQIEAIDTALVAKQIVDQQWLGVGAVASKICADIYGLDILSDDIQINKENFTRFFIIAKEARRETNNNKASLRFSLEHKAGNLVSILSLIADLDVNMSKIQSVPIANKPWEYSFYVDVTFHELSQFEEMTQQILTKTTDLEILGVYRNGKNKSAV